MSFAVIDCETTGLPEQGKYRPADWTRVVPIQVAATVVSEGCADVTYTTLIHWEGGPISSDEAFSVHGISDTRLAEEGVTPREALSGLWGALAACDYVVGQNIHFFDWPCLWLAWRRFCDPSTYQWVQSKPLVDLKMIWEASLGGLVREELEPIASLYGRASTLWSGLKRPRSSLEYLSKVFDVIRPTHDAAEDVEATLAVYESMRRISTDVLRPLAPGGFVELAEGAI